MGRADVGSELSAAGGRGSEVSEWPRSKFPASAVRQRRNFGHRNRIIGPYESVTRSAFGIGRAGKSAKRRQWRMQRGDFEEVPRLAGATVPVSRSAQRWAREPLPYAPSRTHCIGRTGSSAPTTLFVGVDDPVAVPKISALPYGGRWKF